MSQKQIRYEDFVDQLDVEAIEEAIEFEVIEEDGRGNDIGHCFDMYGLHKHGDTTGKFAIHRDKKVYNCFVCGGGTLLSLIMELNAWQEDEATEWLYQFATGDTRTDEEFIHNFLAAFRGEKPNKKVLPWFNQRVLDRYEDETDWFAERGISDTVVSEYNLRYSPHYVRPAPKKEKYADEDEYVGPSIILPHYFRGRLVGWQNRWLDDKRPKWVPKYTNTYDFPREESLFNFDRSKASSGPVILVESVPSVLFLESLGFATAGTFGSQVTQEQARLLRTYQSGLILARDMDDAGEKWAADVHEALDRFIPIKDMDYEASLGWEFEPGFDLGDLAEEEDAQEIVQLLVDESKKVTFDDFL